MAKAQTKAKGKSVAKVEKPRGGTNVVTSSAAAKMRADAAKFSKGFQAKDMAVPFIRIIETSSAAMKKTSGDYNAEAQAGDIYNSASERLVNGEDGIFVIPCAYTRKFTRWGLIDSKEGGGFKADYGTDYDLAKNCIQNDKKQWICKDNKNEHVVESGDYYVIIADLESGKAEQAIISMSGGRWTSAKKWNTLINNLQAEDGEGGFLGADDLPMWAGCYHLTTRLTSADAFEWFVWDAEANGLTLDLKNGENLYNLAKNFASAFEEGKVKVAERTEEDVRPVAEPEAPASSKKGGRGKNF